jgi:hypothetical protein
VALDRAPEGSFLRPFVFAGLYFAAFLAGLLSCRELALTPEPQMPAPAERVKLIPLLRAPLKDENFRRLIAFLASWQFAVNLATPFFTVFFVKQLGLSRHLRGGAQRGQPGDQRPGPALVGPAVGPLRQQVGAGRGRPAVHRLHRRHGRRLADPRPVLGDGLSGGLHALMGLATAGVTLSSGNIALKLSPRGSATAYIAANALISSAAAGLAPLLGGVFADFFAARRLEILVRWTSPGDVLTLMPLRVSSWDFYFLIAAILGLYALHRLAMVKEEGEIDNRLMVGEVLAQARRDVRNVSPIAGLKMLTDVPAALLRDERVRKRLQRMRDRRDAQPGRAPPKRRRPARATTRDTA